MTYKINILKDANEDLDWFRKNDRKNYCKCFDLVREIMEHPRKGTGKPERLKYFDQEVYSRRVNREDRMVYTVYEDIREIDVSSFRRHYEK